MSYKMKFISLYMGKSQKHFSVATSTPKYPKRTQKAQNDPEITPKIVQ